MRVSASPSPLCPSPSPLLPKKEVTLVSGALTVHRLALPPMGDAAQALARLLSRASSALWQLLRHVRVILLIHPHLLRKAAVSPAVGLLKTPPTIFLVQSCVGLPNPARVDEDPVMEATA